MKKIGIAFNPIMLLLVFLLYELWKMRQSYKEKDTHSMVYHGIIMILFVLVMIFFMIFQTESISMVQKSMYM